MKVCVPTKRDFLVATRDMRLISGAFGRVFKGILRREPAGGTMQQVAIKTIKSECQCSTTHDAIVHQFTAIVDACT